jgi:hypothetical protein
MDSNINRSNDIHFDRKAYLEMKKGNRTRLKNMCTINPGRSVNFESKGRINECSLSSPFLDNRYLDYKWR